MGENFTIVTCCITMHVLRIFSMKIKWGFFKSKNVFQKNVSVFFVFFPRIKSTSPSPPKIKIKSQPYDSSFYGNKRYIHFVDCCYHNPCGCFYNSTFVSKSTLLKQYFFRPHWFWCMFFCIFFHFVTESTFLVNPKSTLRSQKSTQSQP